MKNRYWTANRKRVWVLCTAVLIFLTGCRAVDRDNQFEMPSEDLATLGETRAAETAGTERAQDGAEAGPESLSVPYQYGNMQMNVPSGNFMAYGDKVIFAATAGNGFDLFTVDKNTLEVRLLCQDASCNHRRSECISYQKTGNLEQYDGRIFVLGGDLTGPVLELKGDHFESVTNGDAAAFWHGGGDLYVKTPDSELLVYEKGSKSPKTLVEEYPAVQNVVIGDSIYGWDISTDSVVKTDLKDTKPETVAQGVYFMTDGAFMYAVGSGTDGCLYRYDLDFSGALRLTEQEIFPASVNIDEEYLYFRYGDLSLDNVIWGPGGHELYRVAKDGSKAPEKIAELEEDVFFEVYTVPDCPYVFAECQHENGDEIEYVYYAVDKDGSGVQRLEIPES